VLYWTRVQRAGGLIDTTINPFLLPPALPGRPRRPMPMFDTSSLVAQGLVSASDIIIEGERPHPSPSSLASAPFTALAQPASFRSLVALLIAGLKRCSSRQLSANLLGSG
jgi:Putative beta barrel porin-7 (BBP7)